MAQCRKPADLCKLPDWFDKADQETQSALILNCANVNGADYANCVEKHECLVDHVNKLEKLFDKGN